MSKVTKKLSMLVFALLAFVALTFSALTVSPAKAEVVTSDVISINTTAQVRLDDISSESYIETGLRFTVIVNKTELDKLTAEDGEYAGYEVELGAVLIPTKLLNGAELDATADQNVLTIPFDQENPLVNTYNEGLDNEYVEEVYNAVLTKIPTSNYLTDISARGYIKLTKADAEDVILQTADVAERSFGQVASAFYGSGMADAEEQAQLKDIMDETIVPYLAEEINHVAKLADFDSPLYAGTVSVDRGQFDGYKVEYLDEYEGMKGVLKFTGTSVNTGVFKIQLPVAMTATTRGSFTSGGSPVRYPVMDGEEQAKDENGDLVWGDEIQFDKTQLQVDMYVANAGTSAFGFFQNKYLIPDDYPIESQRGTYGDPGWGGLNFAPTLNAWDTRSVELLTADYIRVAVGAGDFEFYIAGIYQGTNGKVKADIADTLGENELANFDSQDYDKLLVSNKIYGGRATPTILESFEGKEGVLKIDSTTAKFITLNLPKAPTQTTITLQVYIVGGEGIRFGMHYQDKAGWKNASPTDNHQTNYARGQWTTLVWYQIDNTGTYTQIDFAWDKTTIEAIYIAGIWDGDQKEYLRQQELAATKNALASTLGENELANFDSQDYLKFAGQDTTYVGNYTYEVGTFKNKANVLKITATNGGGVARIELPKAITSTGATATITLQMYVAQKTGTFGLFQTDVGGWEGLNFEPTMGQWFTITKTVKTGNTVRIGTSSGGPVEVYLAGVWIGDQRDAIANSELAETRAYLASMLNGAELANFDDADYEKFVSLENAGQFSSVKVEYLESYNGKSGVIKFSGTANTNGVFKVYLPKAMTATKTGTISAGGATVTDKNGNTTFDLTELMIEMYVVNPGSGAFGMMQNLYPQGDGTYGNAGWGNQNFTPTTNAWFLHANEKVTADYVRFATGTGAFEFYVGAIYQGGIKDVLASSLTGNELANFDSEPYLDLIGQHPTYNAATFGSGTHSVPVASIGNFHGKTNVLKLVDANATASGTFKLTLPKSPTQTTITLQVYLVANADDATTPARFGLNKQEGGGWDDTAAGTNHKTDFARGEWLTIIFTEIDNTGTYDYLYFSFEKNIDEVYIAGIWDGDVRNDVIKNDLVASLGENELANFNSSNYTRFIKNDMTYTWNPVMSAAVGTYQGKDNVLALTSTDATKQHNATLTLPKCPTQTTITLQVYIVGTTTARFGVFKQEGGGWDDTTAGTNHGTTAFARDQWLTIIFTEIDNTGTYDYLRFSFEAGITEVYIAGIWDGDQRANLA